MVHNSVCKLAHATLQDVSGVLGNCVETLLSFTAASTASEPVVIYLSEHAVIRPHPQVARLRFGPACSAYEHQINRVHFGEYCVFYRSLQTCLVMVNSDKRFTTLSRWKLKRTLPLAYAGIAHLELSIVGERQALTVRIWLEELWTQPDKYL
jgi:hypothetical protein